MKYTKGEIISAIERIEKRYSGWNVLIYQEETSQVYPYYPGITVELMKELKKE